MWRLHSFAKASLSVYQASHQIFVGRDRAHDATRLGRTACTGVSIGACRIEFHPEKAQSLAPIPPATKTSLRFFSGTVRFPTAQVRSDAYPS